MQVFKLYFKLLRKNAVSILIYTGIFLGILILNTLNANDRESSAFYESKVDVAFVNHDKDSELIKGFKEYLSQNCNFDTEIGEGKEDLQDALFFRRVVYVITIPEGYTEDFLAGKEVNIMKQSVPDSTEAAFIDIKINNYMNAAKSYSNTFENISEKEIVSNLKNDLDTNIEVKVQSKGEGNSDLRIMFFNFYAYGIISSLVMGISLIMISFRKLDLKRRNLVAPISNLSFQVQNILGNFIFTLASASVLILVGLHLIHELRFDKNTLLLILNAFVFSICALSMAYLIGLVVKTVSAVNAAANVIGLGLSFVSGVFVPIEYLGDTAINIGRFTPTYWFVMANNKISNLTSYSFDDLSTVFKYMLIEVAFTIALFSISLVVSKNSNTREC
jgi:ABC-2 type transport system permease protein